MGSLGATVNRGTAPEKVITQEQFEEATSYAKSADRRAALAELMYGASEGTVLRVSPNMSLRKEGDAPGDLWTASNPGGLQDGLKQMGADWVKELAHYKTTSPAKATPTTPAPAPKKIAASSVTVTGESNYVFSHGHKPRGYGEWAFLKNKDSVGNDIIWIRGKFSDAKRQAQKEAANRGWSHIYIGS